MDESENERITLTRKELKDIIKREVVRNVNSNINTIVSSKYVPISEFNEIKSRLKQMEENNQVLVDENIQIKHENVGLHNTVDSLISQEPSMLTFYRHKIPKQHPDCNKCKFLCHIVNGLRNENIKYKGKSKTVLELLDILEATNSRLEDEKMVKQKYINSLENKLSGYINSFEEWKTQTIDRLILFHDLENHKSLLELEVAQLKEELNVVNQKLKETMKYKKYQLTLNSKTKLEEQIKALTNEQEVLASNSTMNKYIKNFIDNGVLTDYELRSATLLGLQPGTKLRNMVSILLEVSVYHNDKILYDEIKKSLQPVKSKRIGEKDVFSLESRTILTLGHWAAKEQRLILRNTNLIKETNQVQDTKPCTDSLVEVFGVDDMPKDTKFIQKETNNAIQLYLDIKEKIIHMLNYERVEAMKVNIPAAAELAKMTAEISNAHCKLLYASVEGDEKVIEDVKKSALEVAELFKKHGYEPFGIEDIDKMVNNAFIEMIRQNVTAFEDKDFFSTGSDSDRDNDYSYEFSGEISS